MNILNTIKGAASTLKIGTGKNLATLAFKLKKAGPTIAVVSGVAGTAVAGVWAVKKTIDGLDDIIEEFNEDMSEVKEQKLGKRAKARVYIKGAWKVTKLYAGPILLECASGAFILYGFKIVDGRLVSMTAAAAAAEETNRRLKDDFDGYRKALQGKYGEDFDKDLTWEVPGCKVNGSQPVDEDGNKGTWEIQEVVRGQRGDAISPYAVIFDEMSTEWSNDPEYNKMTLLRIQQTCNDMLHAKGFLFLNDVYKELGVPETRVGQMVGWIDGDGDSYVDFGLYNVRAVNNRAEFINGYEPSILLDFNVDGVIWDKI